MSRLNRLSLSPDPPLVNQSIKYKSGLILQQQERNSPSYQSYKKLNHDYENTDYILHTGSLASRTKPQQNQSFPLKGLVSKRSAEFEAKTTFLQSTLQGSNGSLNTKSVPSLLNLNNTLRKYIMGYLIHFECCLLLLLKIQKNVEFCLFVLKKNMMLLIFITKLTI